MKSFILESILAASLLTSFSVAAAGPAADVNLSAGLTEKGAPLAAHGYDVVSFFTDARPSLGVGAYTAVHGGGAYRFAIAEHLDAFKANPDKYLPQYGGFCAFGAALGKKFDGNPRLWKIVNGKLYFNLNEEIVSKWVTDIPGNIAKADQNWKKIAAKRPDQL
ncbi:MAG TPA: YHS domain-containing (seleno)protein [Thermoanaerobaculia bacterium]|nr:YHS domain-containing (seleno)protein [Thermoanaerobaculia bacterium]